MSFDWRKNGVAGELISLAISMGPQDRLTVSTYRLQTGVSRLLAQPLLVLFAPMIFVLAALIRLTFGVLLIPIELLWFLFLGILLSLSWLWVKVPPIRPLLVPLGVALAALASIYVRLVPDMGRKYQKAVKVALCGSWPYTLYVLQLSLVTPSPEDTL